MTNKKEEAHTDESDVEVIDDNHPLMKQIKEENPGFFDDNDDVFVTWRYGLIKVSEPEFDDDDQCTELVEVYLNKDEDPQFWSGASLNTVESLRMALKDSESHPIITKFYDEGKFEWEVPSGGWIWTKHGAEINEKE